MRTIEVGIHIDVAKGIQFFGVEEVNKSIAGGARVLEMRPAGVVMTQTGEDGQNVQLVIGGCKVEVVLEP